VDRGYLYIAQPPLYRLKKGKKELYLKNEAALEEYLLESATENVLLKTATNQDGIVGEKIKKLAKDLNRYKKILKALDRKIDSRLIDALVQVTKITKGDLKDTEKLTLALAKLNSHFSIHEPDLLNVLLKIEEDSEHGGYRIIAPVSPKGIKRNTKIDYLLLDSPEFEELLELRKKIEVIGIGPFTLEIDDESFELQHLEELVSKINEIAKKGLQIQRYKGLGEMNPEQLWETTMDPKKRTLLQVRVEDAFEADKLFSTLMGDLVEPRREFIASNALSVRNLDI
jgi:DNA gyrase subunit B